MGVGSKREKDIFEKYVTTICIILALRNKSKKKTTITL